MLFAAAQNDGLASESNQAHLCNDGFRQHQTAGKSGIQDEIALSQLPVGAFYE